MYTAFDTLVSTATKIPGQTLPMHLDGSRAIRGNGGAARIASLSRRAPDFRVVPDGKYLGIVFVIKYKGEMQVWEGYINLRILIF